MTTAADDFAVEDAFEALLAGRNVPGDAAGLAAFTASVRATATSPGRPSAALADLLTTGLLTDQSNPSIRTATSAGTLPSRESRVRRRRRFTMILPALIAKLLSAGAVAQAATGAGVVVVVLAGAGAAGVLPDPVQSTIESVVGVETSEETPVDETSGEEAPVAEAPLEEAPVAEAPAEESADGELDYQAWADQGPEDYPSFGAWVSAGASSHDLKDELRAQGLTFGSVVSEWAHRKGMDADDLAAEGVDLEDLTDGTTEDGTVVEDAPEADTTEDDGAETRQSSSDRGNRGNGNGHGNGGGNGSGRD